ncbi:hypothetical protein TBR22_A11880 [Luteitalea sp. TBR-22]|nr:hypothetical protein TBR22_A11880 [Luteitalea sp. TBR-22]
MEQRDRIFGMLRTCGTVMLVTSSAEGRLEGRPMQVVEIDDRTGNIWFLTGRDSRKVHEVAGHAQVALVCQDERNAYLSVSGVGMVVHEPARVREVWRESFRVWFPDGPDDPNLRLLVVEPLTAEYWDTPGPGKVEYLSL